MSVMTIHDVEFGQELDAFQPDTSLANTSAFAEAVAYTGNGRFEDHEKAKAQGLPGALVPGIMGMAFFSSVIHQWSPTARIEKMDTVFRAPMLADTKISVSVIVTDMDEETGDVELDLTIKNEAQETRVMGTASVKLPLE